LVLLLSAAKNESGKTRPNQYKKATAEHSQSTNNQEPQVPLSVLQSSDAALRKAVSTIKKQAEAAEKQANAYKESWDSPSVLVQVGLLVVGIAYSIFAALQWSAIKEQGFISRQQLEQTERAFVFLKEIRVDKIVDPTRSRVLQFRFLPQWENSGTTPTKKLHSHVNWYCQPTTLTKGFWFLPIGDLTPHEYVLGPKVIIGSVTLDVPIEYLRNVRYDEAHLYFYGWAIYRDIFSDTPEHRTRFCYKLVVMSGDLDSVESPIVIGFSVHSEHNDAT
jgi:hypothetical protein